MKTKDYVTTGCPIESRLARGPVWELTYSLPGDPFLPPGVSESDFGDDEDEKECDCTEPCDCAEALAAEAKWERDNDR